MIRIGLRDTKAHFRRFVMSIIAIALGVAFVVGSFCFREMLNNQVSDMMGTNSDHDVYVQGATVTKTENVNGVENEILNKIDADLLTTIADVPGVAKAEIIYSLSNVVLVGTNDEAVATVGAPTLAVGSDNETPWRSAHFTDGTYPTNNDEVALMDFAAQQAHAKVGDTIKIVLSDGPQEKKVSGIFETDSTELGAIIVLITPEFAQQALQNEGESTSNVNTISVYGNLTTPLDENQQQQLADRINEALPSNADAKAVTGDSIRKDTTQSIQDQLGFIQPLIMIFALIALFVGSFIIANTFTMIVRDSMRGYALLRSIGASPAQVFLTVIIQAIILGFVGSAIGVLLGWGILELIAQGMGQMGMPLSGSPAPTVSDVIIGLIVGIVVTIIGATLPAKTAATAPPIQAMNETVNPEKPVRIRGWIGSIMTIVGALLWVLTYRLAVGGEHPTPWSVLNTLSVEWCLGIGAVLVVIGVIVLAPALVGPAGYILGWIPEHLFPVTGKLATRNIARAKRRTANTAAALFIGIAIVSCLGVIASSMQSSVSSIVDNNLNADFAVRSASMTQPIPQKAIDALADVDGVQTYATVKLVSGVTQSNGDALSPLIYDTALLSDIAPAEKYDGDPVQALENNELIVGKDIADNEHWTLGQTITLKGTSVVVDEQATQQAQQAYQKQIESQAATLQQEAQQLLASGDTAGAQKKSEEAQQLVEQAQQVDPATLVKTKEEIHTIEAKIGSIVSDSLYNTGIGMSQDTADKLANSTMIFNSQMYIIATPGTNLEQLHTRLVNAVKSYYTVAVLDKDEFKSQMSSMISQMLAIIYALLALSIIIAIFGIVNTLALSVSERTKEIGLLRAVGTSRAQIRGMLGIEAAILSVFGTLLGIIVGVGAGIVVRAAYESDGLTDQVIPWDQLLVFLILSIIIGLIASISPANRALKKPVLDAVSSE